MKPKHVLTAIRGGLLVLLGITFVSIGLPFPCIALLLVGAWFLWMGAMNRKQTVVISMPE
jgi:hypothetical protein